MLGCPLERPGSGEADLAAVARCLTFDRFKRDRLQGHSLAARLDDERRRAAHDRAVVEECFDQILDR
jgi:hypothetical protein